MPSRAATTSSPRLIQAVPAQPKRLSKLPPGVVEQVQIAFKPKNRLATLMGALLGGFVPVATYVAAHVEAASSDRAHVAVAVLMVLGGLCFSAQTVYGWGKMAFQSGGKALGFTLLVELAMIVSREEPRLAWAALIYLVGINAVATGCTLSLKSRA